MATAAFIILFLLSAGTQPMVPIVIGRVEVGHTLIQGQDLMTDLQLMITTMLLGHTSHKCQIPLVVTLGILEIIIVEMVVLVQGNRFFIFQKLYIL